MNPKWKAIAIVALLSLLFTVVVVSITSMTKHSQRNNMAASTSTVNPQFNLTTETPTGTTKIGVKARNETLLHEAEHILRSLSAAADNFYAK